MLKKQKNRPILTGKHARKLPIKKLNLNLKKALINLTKSHKH